MSDYSWSHGLQHIRLLCLLLSSRVCWNSCPFSQWCYLTISSSAAPFSYCLQSFPASESFPMSHLFTSGGQSIGGSASVLPMNIQGWFLLGFLLISLLYKGLSSWRGPNKKFSNLSFNSKDGEKKCILEGISYIYYSGPVVSDEVSTIGFPQCFTHHCKSYEFL